MDDVAAVVRRAWRETLGRLDDNGIWEEMGGDSLATLQLAYRLEHLLGRVVPLELLLPGRTSAEFADVLSAPAQFTSAGRPSPVFLLPGVTGEESSVVRFRQRLGGNVRFEMIAMADADLAAKTLSDVVATGRHVAAMITARQPKGSVCIAGYSFGGSVALATAAELLDAGRDVAHVAVFDAAFSDTLLAMPRLPLRRRLRRQAGQSLSRLLAWDAGRRIMLAAVDRLAPRPALTLRKFVLRRFRNDARLGWQPRPLTVPILLALSEEFAPFNGPVWRRLYPHAQVTAVPATHLGLLQGDALEIVADAYERFVADHGQPDATTSNK